MSLSPVAPQFGNFPQTQVPGRSAIPGGNQFDPAALQSLLTQSGLPGASTLPTNIAGGANATGMVPGQYFKGAEQLGITPTFSANTQLPGQKFNQVV